MNVIKPWIPWTLGALALAAAGLVYSCGVSTPSATDNKTPLLLHAGKVDDGCNGCHEPDRPSPAHGKGKDCVGCHTFVDEKGGSWLPANPFTHVPAPSTCLPCHKAERPAAPHPEEGDCALCHKFPTWQK